MFQYRYDPAGIVLDLYDIIYDRTGSTGMHTNCTVEV